MPDASERKLAPGLKHSRSVKVTQDMVPPHLRSEAVGVLSTPDLIRLIEQTGIDAVAPLLAAGQTTVGTRVNITHLAATPVGMNLTIDVEVTELDRRRIGFKVEVRDELDLVANGTHERFIADIAQRGPRLKEKMDRWKAAQEKA